MLKSSQSIEDDFDNYCTEDIAQAVRLDQNIFEAPILRTTLKLGSGGVMVRLLVMDGHNTRNFLSESYAKLHPTYKKGRYNGVKPITIYGKTHHALVKNYLNSLGTIIVEDLGDRKPVLFHILPDDVFKNVDGIIGHEWFEKWIPTNKRQDRRFSLQK